MAAALIWCAPALRIVAGKSAAAENVRKLAAGRDVPAARGVQKARKRDNHLVECQKKEFQILLTYDRN